MQSIELSVLKINDYDASFEVFVDDVGFEIFADFWTTGDDLKFLKFNQPVLPEVEQKIRKVIKDHIREFSDDYHNNYIEFLEHRRWEI